MKMKSMNRSLLALSALALALGLSACGGGSSSGSAVVIVTPVVLQAWFDVYGVHCADGAPHAGCNFYSNGTKIRDYQDPNYYNSAYNGGHYLEYANWGYTDSYGFHQYYNGYAWLSNTGILYSDTGVALNETQGEQGRDLFGDVASQESSVISAAAGTLQEYGMAEDKALDFATTLNDFATLPKTRARTLADVDATMQRMYGVDLNTGKGALEKAMQGDTSGVMALNDVVANHLGMSAEASSKMLRKFYAKQIAQSGLTE
jgi:hypothetical protein